MKLLITTLMMVFTSSQVWAVDANQCLKKADDVRNPGDSYEMKIEVSAGDSQSIFQVFLKDGDKTLIVTKEPARDKGRNMLMLDRDFHSYVPNLKRSMRLSLSQKLSGQVANGDISRTRWFGDYEPKLEKVEKGEVQLLLKATKKNLTYEWIRLWVSEDKCAPIRTEYLSLNGKTVLKKAVFLDYKSLAGAVRPSKIKIEDVGGQTSSISILEMNKKDLKDSFFTISNMERMK